MKIKAIIIILCLLSLSKTLDAQTIPYWDANNPGSVVSPAGMANAPFMVATNGILFVIAGGALTEWSQSSGWQTLATFWDTNYPSNFPNGSANTLALGGGSVYVAGKFNQVTLASGGPPFPVDNLVALNFTTGAWTDFGYGQLTNSIYAVTVDARTNVYICCGTIFPYSACDDFSSVATPITNVFLELKNSTTNWTTVGGGLAGIGGSGNMGMCEISPGVYSTGLFSTADPPYWYLLGTDGTNIVMANNFLYGVNTNGTMVFSPFLIEWNGTNWVALGTNAPEPGLYAPLGTVTNSSTWVDSMVVSGTNIFVTGPFSGPEYGYDDDAAGYSGGIGIARFSTGGLYLPTGALLYENTDEDCYTPPPAGIAGPSTYAELAAANGNVYVTGNFDTIQTNLSSYDSWQPDDPTASITVNGIAEFNGTSWSALGTGLQYESCPGSAYGIVADAGAVYVEGIISLYSAAGGPNGFNGAGGNPCLFGDFARWISSAEMNLVFNGQNHTLSWSWDGTSTPYQWLLQTQSPCYAAWYNYKIFSGNVTNISSIGYAGPFQIRGEDSSGNPLTPWSNIQIFNDPGTLTLTHSSSAHTLSWTWNGPTPYAWVIQDVTSLFPTETWGDVDWLSGSTTSVNVNGWSGIYRIYGVDNNDCQVTPFSNQQGFSD